MELIKQKLQNHIWHPFTQMGSSRKPIKITSGNRIYLTDESGKKYMDAISSWWTNLHGHSHPYIAEKIYKQLYTLEHVIFADFTHEPALQLTERLKKHLPLNQSKFFFSDNGSTSVEVALKMAIQYCNNKNEPKKKIVALKNAYHGDTIGAMSVSEKNVFNEPFRDFLFRVEHIDISDANRFKKLVENGDVAAFIYEPLIQGAGGMNIYEPEKLEALLKLCNTNHVLSIADEVMTGFGRTGKWFASDFLKSKPDIMCFSKGLTGGTLPLALTTTTTEIFEAFFQDDDFKNKTFYHGHSYSANPIGCVAALASLDLLERDDCWKSINQIQTSHQKFANELIKNEKIKNVRSLGTILAFDIQTKEATSYFNKIRDKYYDFYIENGVLLRPLGNTVYIMPPYCINKNELHQIYDLIKKSLDTLQ